MKISKKCLQSIAMVVVVVIVMTGFGGWVKYKIKKEKVAKNTIYINGISVDLTPRPFSELITTDFADVKDEVADPSKCDGSKVLAQIKQESSNPKLADFWKDYDPNVDKLTILDNCWRQYENQYVKFKFRDLNGSLLMYGSENFGINSSGFLNNIGVYDVSRSGKNYIDAVLKTIQSNEEFLGMTQYKNPQGVIILRTEVFSHQAVNVKKSHYTVDLPGIDEFIDIHGYSDRAMKDILSTIEIKK